MGGGTYLLSAFLLGRAAQQADRALLRTQPYLVVRLHLEVRPRGHLEQLVAQREGEQEVRAQRLHDAHLRRQRAVILLVRDGDVLRADAERNLLARLEAVLDA